MVSGPRPGPDGKEPAGLLHHPGKARVWIVSNPNTTVQLEALFHALFPVTREMPAHTIGMDSVEAWDSAAHVNLIAALESDFDVFFEDVEALLELRDFQAVASYLHAVIDAGNAA